MKTLITITLFAFALTVSGQDFLQTWTDYEKYCNELVPDTITISGTIVQRAVPITDEQGQVISYVMVSCGDTTWDKYECDEFKNESLHFTGFSSNHWDVSLGRLVINQPSCDAVTKKVICQVKRQQSAFDELFIIWLKQQ